LVESNFPRGTTNQTQIWEVMRQYGISALVSQTSFGGETSGSVAKCRLSSQASEIVDIKLVFTSHLKKQETTTTSTNI